MSHNKEMFPMGNLISIIQIIMGQQQLMIKIKNHG